MANNANVIAKLAEIIDGKDDLTSNDFVKYMKQAYKEASSGKKTKKSKTDGEKRTREASKYNIFMKEKMAELKAASLEDGAEKIAGKDLMKKVAEMWNEEKGKSSDEEKEEKVVEKEEEIEEVKVEEEKEERNKGTKAPRKALSKKK